jgi:hypothetical protein
MQLCRRAALARPEDGVLSRVRISFDTGAPCVLASERPSHPSDERHHPRPSQEAAAQARPAASRSGAVGWLAKRR